MRLAKEFDSDPDSSKIILAHDLDHCMRSRPLKPRQLALLAKPSKLKYACSNSELCSTCRSDQNFLRRKAAPVSDGKARAIRFVDLFSGCGGMTLGLVEAARRAGHRHELALACDADPEVIEIFKRNFGETNVRVGDIDQVFDGEIGAEPTTSERQLARELGTTDILVGGPPCQGHSDLNNHTRRNDPKNALYLRMARAAEILKPAIVVIENVEPVRWDKTEVVQSTIRALAKSGYRVAGRVIDLRMIGVPQRRRRFVLLAWTFAHLDPAITLEGLASGWGDHHYRSVRWAIEDLKGIESKTAYDSASKPTSQNARRISFLFDNALYDLPNGKRPQCHRDGNHSYVSVYGRLRWDHPAQTITTGFGCMGQGRYVHPAARRTITPHEAARLQTFPDWFDFGAKTRRGVLAKAIGNAVPPMMMAKLGEQIIGLLTPKHGKT